MSNSREIILIGGGGHCRSCIDVIEAEGRYKIIGIVDEPAYAGDHELGYPLIETKDDLADLRERFDRALVTYGQLDYPAPRMRAYARLKELGFILPIIQSPISYVSRHATIGEGTIIMHGAIVNCAAVVGVNCIINSKALIEHDARVGSHTHIATNAIINGGVTVGARTFFGSGTTSVHGIEVPEDSFVKAGGLERGNSGQRS